MTSNGPGKKTSIPAAKSVAGELRIQLMALLGGAQAHTSFEHAAEGFPSQLRGVVPEGLPYSAWQLLEHMRIAQRDILDFSGNADGRYKPLRWPEDYWPKNPEPPNEGAWDACIRQITEDRAAFEQLVQTADDNSLVKPFPWGDGQNLLREAFLVADHQAYHVGELVVLRRLLKAWKT